MAGSAELQCLTWESSRLTKNHFNFVYWTSQCYLMLHCSAGYPKSALLLITITASITNCPFPISSLQSLSLSVSCHRSVGVGGATGIKATLSFQCIIGNWVKRKLNYSPQPEGSAIFHPDLFCYLQKNSIITRANATSQPAPALGKIENIFLKVIIK